MSDFKAIDAMAENRVLGRDGDIPWHLPEDFKWFKRATMGGILVMGRKTYESIGRPLPGRETVVLSRTAREIEGVQTISEPGQLETLPSGKTIWIAGGADIYAQLLPHCRELFLTRVHRECLGDASFPPFEHLFTRAGTVQECDDFTVEHWLRS